MAETKITLADFLDKHSAPAFLATIEPISGSDKVSVTPWQPDRGCLCHAALDLPRSAIASVTITENTHNCCGKQLRVVAMEFAPSGAQLQDVFRQLLSRGADPAHVDSHVPSGPPRPEISPCPWCVSICRHAPGSAACTACWEGCYSGGRAERPMSCGPGREYCECVGACIPNWACWRLCGAHG